MKARICNAILGAIVFLEYLALLYVAIQLLSLDMDGKLVGFLVIIGVIFMVTLLLCLIFGLATFFYISKNTDLGKKGALIWTLWAMLFAPIVPLLPVVPASLFGGSWVVGGCVLALPFVFVATTTRRKYLAERRRNAMPIEIAEPPLLSPRKGLN